MLFICVSVTFALAEAAMCSQLPLCGLWGDFWWLPGVPQICDCVIVLCTWEHLSWDATVHGAGPCLFALHWLTPPVRAAGFREAGGQWWWTCQVPVQVEEGLSVLMWYTASDVFCID